MKTKLIFTILTLVIAISAFCSNDTMVLTFTAENNGQHITLDSILIENLTQGGDTTIYAPDTVLLLDYISGISSNETIGKSTFSVSQNYPNPFNGKTEVNLSLPKKEHINITVRDILGRVLANYDNTLSHGNHSFAFYSGDEKHYLLTITGIQQSKTIKMLKMNSNTTNAGKCKIIYTKFEDNRIGFKSQKATNGFVFNIGDELKYTAYTDVEKEEISDNPSASQIYTFQFEGWTPCPGMSTVTDIDSNSYNTVQIGSQCWMKENLKTTTYRNGITIPNVTDANSWGSLNTGAYVWYENDNSWKGPYGALYNWYSNVDTNGLCPTGWHVPTNAEWTVLTDFIGGIEPPNANKLKSCRQVDSPLGDDCSTTKQPRWDEHHTQYGNDDYGFSGLPGGFRYHDGIAFFELGYYGGWWTSSYDSSDEAWYIFLYNFSGYINVIYSSKKSGFSVRCLKN